MWGGDEGEGAEVEEYFLGKIFFSKAKGIIYRCSTGVSKGF
jgi:hypothetical protein